MDTTLSPISIWRPTIHQGEAVFTRPEPGPFGDHYAARRIIPAAKPPGATRVCYFGESVAAGYLYAPHLTPAQVLERQLTAVGDAEFDVVDLARTNETLGSLVETVAASLQLEPDVAVIFAGNNWNLLETPELSPYFPTTAGRQEYGELLRARGLLGPPERAARRRLEAAGRAFAEIDEIVRPAGIAVVVVVPQVNLADWESRQPAPWLPDRGTVRWHECYRRATADLTRGDTDEARREADQMLDLDEGLVPTAFRIFAAAHARDGATRPARVAAEAEVAADHYATMCFLTSPRATPLDQEVQRRAARHHGFALVDLPEVFDLLTEGELPGRRLFLDYCHLTAEGIEVAMSEVAAATLRAISGVAVSAAQVRAAAPLEVPVTAEATARLGAAIHTAHRLLTVDPAGDIVRYWLGAALAASPGIESTLLDVVEARAAPVPAVLTAAQRRNLVSPYRLGFQHGWRYDYLDLALIDAIGDVLAARGRSRAETVDPTLIAHRAVADRPVELVYPPDYLWEPVARFYPEAMELADVTAPAFHRAAWPQTELGFVADGRHAIDLSLVARLPRYHGSRPPGPLEIAVNGRPAGRVTVGDAWVRHHLRVAPEILRPGINRLTLDWPALPDIGAAMLELAVDRLERGISADIHPVFGELFSVRVAASA